MPYYQLDNKSVSADALKKHAELIESVAVGEGELLIETKEDLPRIKGAKKLTRKVSMPPQETVQGMPLAGLTNLERSRKWKLEEYSTRKAELSHVPVRAGSQSLLVSLGGGRGREVIIGDSLILPESAKAISLRAKGLVEDSESISIAIVLTTERERPWLELGSFDLQAGKWQEIRMDFSAIDTKKLSKIDRVNIVITTDADEGCCQFQDIQIATLIS